VSKDSAVMSLKSFVNNKEQWDAFLEHLDVLIAKEHKSMESLTDTKEVFRHQGSIRTLRNLKYLRETINGPK
jgi:hypothetical protein